MSKVITTQVGQALSDYYLPFAKYVNQTRALPDARDGLKRAHRFVLFAMKKAGFAPEKATKGTKVVGEAMTLLPHGDQAVYGTAIRLAQAFALRYPLVDVIGNAGTITAGDDYAAYRYVEMNYGKASYEAMHLLDENALDEKDYVWNYTNDVLCPSYFPSMFPLVVNGCTGLGVGMSSSIPQWNLREFCDSAKKLLRNPEIDFDDIVCYPDFCTRGIIINKDEVKESLREGKGKAIIIRGKTDYDAQNHQIIITELPYQVFTTPIVEQIQRGFEAGTITGISSAVDATDKDGMRIVIQLEKDSTYTKVLKQLYKETSLQSHFNINMMMLENGTTPRIYGFKEILQNYLTILEKSVLMSTKYKLEKALGQLEIIEGYIKVIPIVEEVIQVIKKSSNKEDAKNNLVSKFGFTVAQSASILEMKLSRLTGLEVAKLEEELKELRQKIDFFNKIINDKETFRNYINREIDRIKITYGDERRTTLTSSAKTDDEASLEAIVEEKLIITISADGIVHSEKIDSFQKGNRGRKGGKLKVREKDILIEMISVSNTESILALSSLGRSYTFSGLDIPPEGDTSFTSLFELKTNEKIIKVIPYDKMSSYYGVCFITKDGTIKITELKDLESKRKTGISAIKIKDGDEIVSTLLVENEKDQVIIITKSGYYNRYPITEVRPTGRVAIGVRGILLRDDDYVVGGCIYSSSSDGEIVTITNSGYIKKSDEEEISMTSRARKGSIIHKLKEDDTLAGIIQIRNNTDLIIASTKNYVRFPLEQIDTTGRCTQGVIGIKTPEQIIYLGQAVE